MEEEVLFVNGRGPNVDALRRSHTPATPGTEKSERYRPDDAKMDEERRSRGDCGGGYEGHYED